MTCDWQLWRVIALCLSSLVLSVPHSVAADPAVKWRTDYNAARKEATEKGRPLFLDFGTEECYHCRRLDQNTFKDPRIIQLLNDYFIPLKIDANREPALTQALKIQAYPTLVLASNDGKILGLIEGYMEANRLMDHLTRAVSTSTPDWMARDYQEVTKAINTADYSRAVALLKGIIEDGKDRPVQEKAKQLMLDIEQQALARFARAKQMEDKGQYLESMDTLTDLLKRYSGTQAANEGAKLFTSLADKPEIRTLQKNKRALEVLALAKEEFKGNRFLSCLDYCEVLMTAYKETPAGIEGQQLAIAIKDSPERMEKVCSSMNDRLAQMYFTLAEALEKKGKSDEAIVYLEKIVKTCSGSVHAETAQTKLTSIKTNTSSQPVKFTKPKER
jgi:thioredoxin-related protein